MYTETFTTQSEEIALSRFKRRCAMHLRKTAKNIVATNNKDGTFTITADVETIVTEG